MIVVLELEVDPIVPGEPVVDRSELGSSLGDQLVSVAYDDRGHGFGLTELVTITVSIGAGVAAELIASSIKAGVRGVIKKVRAGATTTDGSVDSIARVISDESADGSETESDAADR